MKTKWLDRVLAVILAVCLVVGMMPATALATSAGTDDTTIVSDEPSEPMTLSGDTSSSYTVGTDGTYETISAAQTAASEAGVTAYTIQLVSDITTTSTVTIDTDTDVTLDLNGKTWTASTASSNPIYIKGCLTVTDNSSSDSATWGGITSTGTGVNNGGLFYLPSQSSTTCELTINRGTFTCQSNSSADGVISAPSPTCVEINGGVFYGTKWHVISAYGQLVITDGKFYLTGESLGQNVAVSAIYVTGAGNVSITGGYIESNASGIYVAQSTSGVGVSVSNTTIKCNSETYYDSASGYGTAYGIYTVAGTLTLDKVAIEGNASCGVLTVVETNITDSTITGSVQGINATGLTNGSAVATVTLDNCTVTGGTAAVRVAGVEGISVTIDGGTYTATDDAGSALLVAEDITNGTVTGTIAVNSGTFSSDVSNYIDTTSNSVTDNGNGTWTVGGTKTYVAQIGTERYETLAEAITAANSNDTITLLADVTESVTIAAGQNITLDLNGYTLTNTDGFDTISVALGGTLTVVDKSEAQTGTVNNTSTGYAAVFNNGTANLNGGTYTRTAGQWYTIVNHGEMTIDKDVTVTVDASVDSTSSMIENGYYYSSGTNERTCYVENVNQNPATLTITGGTFSGGHNTVKNDEYGQLTISGGDFSNTTQYTVMNWNIAEITGGTFECNTSAVVYNASSEESSIGQLTISGGEFKSTVNCAVHVQGGTAVITDGTFIGDSRYYVISLPSDPESEATATITGGTYSSQYYCSNNSANYEAVANGDGTYGVQAVKVAQVKDAEGNVTQYATLDEAIEAVQPGGTITLLGNVTLADDTPAKIMDKGTADSPITLDLNGYIISGSNSKNGTNEDTTTPGGILWVYGSYVTLTDTSTSEEKGGIINTYAGSSAAYGLVIRSTESNVGAVTIDSGVRIEVTGTTSSSARAIHFQNNTNTSGTLTLTIEDAKVTANKGLTVYVSAGNGYSCMATINGGEFNSTGKANTTDNFSGSSTTMTINGGTFYNWGTSAWNEVAKDHVICIAQPEENGTFTVTIAAQAPDDYVALVDAVGSYRAICLTEGSDLYAIHNIQTPAGTNGSGRTIHVKKDVSYIFPDGKYYGYNASNDASNHHLTLDLAEGVTLSGGMNLYSADITVTGEGTLSNDFTWTPAEGFGMTANGETDGLYSCRLTTGGGAELIKADGTSIVYKNIVGAIAAAKLNPGSIAKMLADYTNSTYVDVSVYNNVVADFTLDLNGYTYTYSGSSDAIKVSSGATLTVTDSSTVGGGAIVTKGARETFIANSALATTGTGGTIIIGEGVTVKNLVLLDAPNSKLTVAGTIDTTGFETYAISGNGSTGKGGTEITIKETAVIKSDSTVAAPAIYHPQSGTLTVEGGTISGYGGIQMCSGNLVITGDPTITATGSKNMAAGEASGGIPDGAAISIVDRNYPGGTPTVEITGNPTVTAAENVEAVQAYTWSNSEKSEWAEAGDSVNISGGTYSTKPEETLLATGYVANVKEMETGYVVELGGEAFNTETKTYGTLAEMLTAAKSGETVQLLTDVTAEDVVSVESGITLDLNGHVLTASNGLKGRVIDSSDGDGQLICDSNSLSLSADSEYLPIYDSTFGCYRLYKYGLESATKAVAADNGDRVTFYFRLNLKQKTAYDLLAQGNSGVSVKVKVDWTEKNVNQSLIVELNQQTFSSAQSIANNSGAERVVLYVAVTGVRGLVSGTTVSGTPKISVDRWDGDKQSDAIEYEVLSDGTSDETDEGE